MSNVQIPAKSLRLANVGLKFKSGGGLKLWVFSLDMLIFMNIELCNCQK